MCVCVYELLIFVSVSHAKALVYLTKCSNHMIMESVPMCVYVLILQIVCGGSRAETLVFLMLCNKSYLTICFRLMKETQGGFSRLAHSNQPLLENSGMSKLTKCSVHFLSHKTKMMTLNQGRAAKEKYFITLKIAH